MEYLFEKSDTRTTFGNYLLILKNEIERLSNDQICNTDLDELVDYYFDKHQIEPITIFKDNIIEKMIETKIKTYNPFYRNNDFEEQYFYADGYRIIHEIPFEGDTNLLYLRPNTYTLHRHPVNNVINSTEEKHGEIIFSLEFSKNELENNKDNIKAFVLNKFNTELRTYYGTIATINSEVVVYNNNLRNTIMSYLQTRLKKASDYISLSEKLDIPLVQNPNAPNIKPILLKKVKKNKAMSFPIQRQKETEYEISDADYNNIKSVIDLACVSMEKSARTFYKLQEEELRDVILSNLNTHYQGTATGETFNKRGKTDIYIPFDNKFGYIGECKIWHGIKKFNEAIEQLFSYMTWRDTKTSLIIFNKDAKDFKKILETVNEDLISNKLCENSVKTKDNEWQCVFKKYEDSEERIKMNIVIYDLRIDE